MARAHPLTTEYICQRLRRNGFAKPIVMLTAKGAEGDIVLGLEAGANDYITKPLRLGELIARIRTQLRQFRASDDAQFEIGNISFVPANKMLHEIGSDRMQALTEKEATILKFLYRAFPNDVTKDELLAEVWGFQNGVSAATTHCRAGRASWRACGRAIGRDPRSRARNGGRPS